MPKIVTLAKCVQLENAFVSIVVILAGIVISSNFVQLSNAYCPMLVKTLFGIVTLLKLVHP